MRFDPERHRRRSMRLKGYDYSQAGAYFVTICTQGRACLFGEVVDGEMRLNDAGRMVVAEWERLPALFSNVVLDAFVVMPNHIHGIVILTDPADDATDGATAIGATISGATTGGAATGGATTRVAPTTAGDDAPPVGAGLVPALSTMAGDDAPPVGAGLVPALSTMARDDADPVGAGLVPAPSVPAPSTPAQSVPAPSVPAPSTPAQSVPAPSVPAPSTPAQSVPALSTPAPTLGDVIGAFKSRVTVEYIRGVKTFGWTPFDRRLWQRNYYEHIIRNEEALNRIRRYIVENPIRWAFDRENPFAVEIESEETWLH
jgi:putative transposase